MDLKPGQKIVVIEKDGVVHLIPQKPVKKIRGFVKGVNTRKPRKRGRKEHLLQVADIANER